MSATQRRKGAVAEREIVALLKTHWPKARRSSDGREQQWRGDIINGPANVHIEIKRQERLNVPAAFDQIRRDSDAIDMPLLIHRPSRCEWMATVPLDRLLALLAHREGR